MRPTPGPIRRRDGEPRHGVWPLQARAAVRLCTRETTMIRPVHGTLWITFEPRPGSTAPVEDLILLPGGRMVVPPGRVLVIGPCGRPGQGASFHWQLPLRQGGESVFTALRDRLLALLPRPLAFAR
jgi:hypothetical protein